MIEGLQGVEVVVDDLVLVGFGDTMEVASRGHDQNLDAVLQRYKERDLKLNDKKVRLRLTEVPFIDHVATAEDLCVDPNKVQAILEMPPPEDIAAVQHLLGLAQYLSKFLPHLSDITKPLRDLTKQEIEWMWGLPQQDALDKLKKAVSSTPISRYYNLQKRSRCDVMHRSQVWELPCYRMVNLLHMPRGHSHLTETRYAQIEKELLAIVFACDHFEAYTYSASSLETK